LTIHWIVANADENAAVELNQVKSGNVRSRQVLNV